MSAEINSKQGRITFIISSLAGGGAEGVCVSVANGLAEMGWKIDLVVLHLDNASYIDRVSESVNLVDLKVPHARYAFNPIRRYIKNNKVKKVLVFNYELAVLLVVLRKLGFAKFKIFARNINTLSQKQKVVTGWRRKYIIQPLIDTFYCQVDHIINQCEAMEQDLLRLFPQLTGKTSVIYNPVNRIVEGAASEIDFPTIEKQDYLLSVGRLEEQKALHYAIQVFAEVADEFPGLRLKIVGEGSLKKKLKNEVLRLGVKDRVDFEGFQKDVIPYYLGAKLTLLTSLYEGFPNVLIESISLGTPVISFDCPSGPSEIVEEKINGCLVNYLDIRDFSDSLRQSLLRHWDYSSVNRSSYKFKTDNIVSRYSELLI